MKGFEPSTFAMARRRSSQLSYIRGNPAILARGEGTRRRSIRSAVGWRVPEQALGGAAGHAGCRART
jgi:hypothetical protein